MWSSDSTKGIHWEARRGTPKEACDYCKKGDQRKGEWESDKDLGKNFGRNSLFWEDGTLSNQGKRTDIAGMCAALKAGKCMLHLALSRYRAKSDRRNSQSRRAIALLAAGTPTQRAFHTEADDDETAAEDATAAADEAAEFEADV